MEKEKHSPASNGGLIKNNKTMERLIVIDCFNSMGLDLKHLKATEEQEWLMLSENQVLYNTQT